MKPTEPFLPVVEEEEEIFYKLLLQLLGLLQLVRIAKELRAKGIRVDDDLTRAQQQREKACLMTFRSEKKGAQTILQRLRVEILLYQQDAYLREGEGKQGVTSCLMIL
ncbi:TPA: hypothetical protein ACH3X1_015801 [Trebouxia sp. C0004]